MTEGHDFPGSRAFSGLTLRDIARLNDLPAGFRLVRPKVPSARLLCHVTHRLSELGVDCFSPAPYTLAPLRLLPRYAERYAEEGGGRTFTVTG